MAACLEIAERYDLLLGIECEASNCINTADRARLLMDQFDTPRLKIIMDVANLFQHGEARPERVRPIMDHAFDLLGDDIYLAHGKDIRAGDGLAFTHAGNGIVDFDYFFDALTACGYEGGMPAPRHQGGGVFPRECRPCPRRRGPPAGALAPPPVLRRPERIA